MLATPRPLLLRSAALLVGLSAVLSALFPAPALPAEESPSTSSPDPATVERLVAVGKLWGEIKFFHPALVTRELDWDRALLETLPLVEAAETTEDLRAAVEHLLGHLDDPATRLLPPPAPPDGESDGGENGEEQEAEQEEKDGVQGESAEEGETDGKTDEEPESAEPSVEPLADGFVRIDATDYDALAALGRWQGGLFTSAFEEAAEAPGVVLDLRRPGADNALPDRAEALVARALEADLPRLLSQELLLPAARRRVHSGYAPQRPGAFTGLYYSALLRNEHEVLAPAEDAHPPQSLVVVTDEGSGSVRSLAMALASAGQARLVHHGRSPMSPAGGLRRVDVGAELGSDESLVVLLRSADLVLPDGSVGYVPHRTVEPASGEQADPALAAALELLQGRSSSVTQKDTGAAAGPIGPSTPRRLFEKPYADDTYPSREMRLLALFRFWNVIEYFFPYQHLLDRPWDEVLPEMLPRFVEAQDEVEYVLAVAELVARIQDTHGGLRSEVWDRWVGTYHPPFQIRFVEHRPVVTWISPNAGEAVGGIEVGDVVTAIDGEPETARRELLTPYLAVSTPQALELRLEFPLLAGAEDSRARLTVEGEGGAMREVEVERNRTWRELIEEEREARSEPVWGRTPEGWGRIDLVRLTRQQVPEMFEELREAPALIFDLRGYPHGTAWAITPYLAAESAPAARFRRRLHLEPSNWTDTDLAFEQPFPAGAPWQYEGKIVVLINAHAISQSEHTCLFFESAYDDVTFVGSATNGANGDVTGTLLPGGIWATFTGHDVRHADGRQLQRVGIQPDLPAEPTIEGVRAGRDEVLEAARRFLISALEDQGGSSD